MYRLGRNSARRPLAVIGAWFATLVIAGLAFLGFGGTLADSFSIPGLETERVTEELAAELPELTGGTARVVFQTTDGSAFSAEQQQSVGDVLTTVAELDHVKGTMNPFATQAQREQQAQQLTEGADALDAAVQELDATEQQLAAAQTQLDAAIEQAKNAGVYEANQGQFEAQQAQIDDGLAQVSDAREQVAQQREQLELGRQLAGYAADLRMVSQDGSVALVTVSFAEQTYALTPEDKQAVIEAIRAAPIEGVSADFSADLTTDVSGVLGPGEVGGVIVALLVLSIMMRAFWPSVQPLMTSVVGVGVGVLTALAFSGVQDMQSITPVLGVMLGLAVGIDYSLFILNRHRKQFRDGMDLYESIGLANGTSGNAVVFAGATVMVALLALNITGIPFLGVMGTVAAFCVAVAVLSAISLTPAVLGLIGPRVLGRAARNRIGSHAPEKPIKPLRNVVAVGAVVASVGALLVVAAPSLSMRLGLPDGTQEPQESTQYQAYFAVADNFGDGVNGTMLVTARLAEPVAEDDVLATQVDIESVIAANDDVAAVAPVGVSADRDYMAFQVIPAEGPSSESTEQLVHDLRALSPLEDGTEIGVAGEASGSIDVIEKLNAALPLYLTVVVALSLVILVVVFRSILVPVLATAGFVLSLFAAFGAVTAVYQWGWMSELFGVHDPAPLLAFLPILLTGILFGLAMDYQLFITTGMREAYVHGMSARHSVVAGVRHGRAVVTAAAIIMASVFGGFVFSELGMVRPIGFGLAVGVLFDAFVVRMVLVPSLMHLAGEGAWWLPRWLDRILPDVDVEGAQLEREHPLPAEHSA
nr:MMPL family transporter [Demequina sp. TTPB684]